MAPGHRHRRSRAHAQYAYSGHLPGGLRGDPMEGRGALTQAAEALGLTATILEDLGIIDGVEEPLGGAHRDSDVMIRSMRDSIVEQLASLEGSTARPWWPAAGRSSGTSVPSTVASWPEGASALRFAPPMSAGCIKARRRVRLTRANGPGAGTYLRACEPLLCNDRGTTTPRIPPGPRSEIRVRERSTGA